MPNTSSKVVIIPIETKRQMNLFVNFSIDLYKDNPYYVPEFTFDTKATLTPGKNPALDFCQAQPFLAYINNKVVGRVVALINPVANEKWESQDVRFGWIDFIDDYDVCAALLDAVAAWGKERGMTNLNGPLGFTDLDREGGLVDGYDKMSTMSLAYSFSYYAQYYDKYGLQKSIDWVEYNIRIPDIIPDKYASMANIVAQRFDLHIKKYTSHKKFVKEAAQEIFDLLNECYSKLYGYSELNQKQIDKTISDYIPFVDLNLISLIYDKDEQLVSFALMIPSLAKAIQKAKGRLFPFGWWHLVKALYLKHDDTIEFLLVAIKPTYQGKGLNAMLISDLLTYMNKSGYKYCETNANLENNLSIQAMWKSFDKDIVKRRRAYIKEI